MNSEKFKNTVNKIKLCNQLLMEVEETENRLQLFRNDFENDPIRNIALVLNHLKSDNKIYKELTDEIKEYIVNKLLFLLSKDMMNLEITFRNQHE